MSARDSRVPTEQTPSDAREWRNPALGIVPRTPVGAAFWVWGVLNTVLTFLPVWNVAFNEAWLVGEFLPLTVLWSYAVFTSNMLLGITLYLFWARPWANAMEASPIEREASGSNGATEAR
jgi:type VI protein secretion system component VasK